MAIEDGAKDRVLRGLELAKVHSPRLPRHPHFAIGPVIGASATLFTHQHIDKMSDAEMELDDKQLNWTFSAGLLGRFDVFAAR